jgi:hypothetical protein
MHALAVALVRTRERQMDDLDAGIWLDAWIEENLLDPSYRQEDPALAREADLCRAAAEAAGISRAALDDVAGGDLPRFLAKRRRQLSDPDERK